MFLFAFVVNNELKRLTDFFIGALPIIYGASKS